MEYWPSVVYVQTLLRLVQTATHFSVQHHSRARSVISKKLLSRTLDPRLNLIGVVKVLRDRKGKVVISGNLVCTYFLSELVQIHLDFALFMATDKKMESRRSTLKTKAKEFLYELMSLIIYRYY